METLTNIDKSTGSSFAELFGLVRERDFHHAGNVSRRCLHTDSVGCDQLLMENNSKQE